MNYHTPEALDDLRAMLADLGVTNTDEMEWETLFNGRWYPWWRWNKLASEWQELKEYLDTKGIEFNESLTTGRDFLVEDEAATFKTPEQFYKRGWMYLYHLTAFDLDQWKTPYFQYLHEQIMPCDVLDYGCGIGADGLRLMRRKFTPSFADYKSRCTDYLRWRLKRRGLDLKVYDIEKDEIPRHDLLVSFDVIEHVEDVEAYLRRVAVLGRTVAFNMPEGESRSTLHYEVDVGAAMELIEEIGTVRLHRVVNAFQHFVIFDTPEPEYHPEPEDIQEVENGSS